MNPPSSNEPFLDSAAPPASAHAERYATDSAFAVRGVWSNPMTDAAWPLLALSIRLSTSEECPSLAQLHYAISDQIRTILKAIRQHDYDEASIEAYSYSLCLFMDEVVMSRPWGVQSDWSTTSLLSEFHQETWGGEKFFTLLERMSTEAAKYQHVLEAMYFFVCLGLKGKYAVHARGDDAIERLIRRLHRQLRALRGAVPENLTTPLGSVAPRHLRLSRQWPWWSPWLLASGVLAALYTAYAMRLSRITGQVLESLQHILKL
jgi:type VI secretion system protein ImpK